MSTKFKIYNSKSREIEDFKPFEEGKVKMYVCGPTVYDYIHVGNARPIVVFDVLHRYLKHMGYDVKYVQNFTDIDDRIIVKAIGESVDYSVIAKRYMQAFEEDTKDLNLLCPDVAPKATEHIGEIIKLIQKLEQKGIAYQIDDGVYFDTSRYADYGNISGRNLEELQAGVRIEVDDQKRNPMDFALWKAEKPGEPSWDSPWGKGRPGWHIECSAMSMKHLGETLDIHGGGSNLLFPHHENEAAQSTGATGREFVRYWMHNGYININNQKMSKSLGNFFTVRDIRQQFDLEVLRFFLLSVHYRSPVNFSLELMEQAKAGLDRLYNARDTWKDYAGAGETSQEIGDIVSNFHECFLSDMNNDLNTAGAIGEMFKFVNSCNSFFDSHKASAADYAAALASLAEHAGILGILSRDGIKVPDEVAGLLEKRRQARADRDWKLSDELRDQIHGMGYTVEDTPKGQKIKKL